ncbi:MAG: M48 family metallopeptidase [Abditibacteriota bacterium]|nr:M48 family metallopeptidase [Abditibacteriota bacterium]
MKKILIILAVAALATSVFAATKEDEIYMGATQNDAFVKMFGELIDKDPKAVGEIRNIGANLAKYAERTDIPYEFHVIDLAEFNSFAFPGGYVYVTERFWNILDEDEKAALVAHEIAHVDGRHAINNIDRKKKRDIAVGLIARAVGVRGLYRNAVDYVNNHFGVKYSSKNEEEADEKAVKLCNAAGYNPASELKLIRKINRIIDQNGTEGNVLRNFYAAHPNDDHRIKDAESFLVAGGFDIPAEEPENLKSPFTYVGLVTKVKSESKDGFENKITFVKDTATAADRAGLERDSIVWVMRNGWDGRYENRMPVPAGRGIVTNFGFASEALLRTYGNAKISEGMGVYVVPQPKADYGVGRIVLSKGEPGALKVQGAENMDRYYVTGTVWNDDYTALVNKVIGYLVVIDSTKEEGYTCFFDESFNYSYCDDEVLPVVSFEDPDADRWIGTIAKAGSKGTSLNPLRKAQKLEVKTNKINADNSDVYAKKTYDVVLTDMDENMPYSTRVVATAQLTSVKDGKVFFRIIDYVENYNAANVEDGLDIYEQIKE